MKKKNEEEKGLIELIEKLPTFIAYNTETKVYSEDYDSFKSDVCGYLTIVKNGRYWEISYGTQGSGDFVYGTFECAETLKEAVENFSEQINNILNR